MAEGTKKKEKIGIKFSGGAIALFCELQPGSRGNFFLINCELAQKQCADFSG